MYRQGDVLLKEVKEIKAIKDVGLLTKSEKVSLSTKEIAKLIRDRLKKEVSGCRFSVTKNEYSGGASITICLISADFKVFRAFGELSEEAIFKYKDDGYKTEQTLKEMCERRHAQLNIYTAKKEYNPDTWNNGHFLTKEAHQALKAAVGIADYYNYDDSDAMTDYFDVNFYLHLKIGRYDKPLEE